MAEVLRVINDIVSPCSLFEQERALGALSLIPDYGIMYENVQKGYFITNTRAKIVI